MVNSVIIVLGAATTKEAGPSPALLRRTRSGCELALQKDDHDLLLCGGQTNSHHFVKESEIMARIASEHGLDENRIVQEGQSRNTFENAIFSKRLIKEKGWQNITVVSDRVHLLRARMVFGALGIKARFITAHGEPKMGSDLLVATLYEVPALLWYAIRILSGHYKPYLNKS